jgi:hypothetical protein
MGSLGYRSVNILRGKSWTGLDALAHAQGAGGHSDMRMTKHTGGEGEGATTVSTC